ncbi:ribonuclease H1-like [Copidosoma floridanum]|uniref:ribonuclease H1-like n=1 Tax=Copidosoma floridanum TaxID=29053 RepID=UPI0006C9C61F|nr:ribonuclease H1-like [Copidosoma floridanum]
MGYRKSTPISVLTAESKIPLLKHRLKYLAHSFLLKLISNKENTTLKNGSKTNINESPKAGFGTWSYDDNLTCSYNIPGDASIFSAECLGLSKALDFVIANGNNSFKIFTDSLSVLKALNKLKGFKYESPLILILKKKLAEAQSLGRRFQLFWIPAHIGIKGNEAVDKVAKSAAIEGPPANLAIPATDLKKVEVIIPLLTVTYIDLIL